MKVAPCVLGLFLASALPVVEASIVATPYDMVPVYAGVLESGETDSTQCTLLDCEWACQPSYVHAQVVFMAALLPGDVVLLQPNSLRHPGFTITGPNGILLFENEQPNVCPEYYVTGVRLDAPAAYSLIVRITG